MSANTLHIPWEKIDTLLLDMDGTLLDLHFDSYFWKEYIPLKYAQKRGLDCVTAKRILVPQFKKAEQSLNWYCIDYWSNTLNLDVGLLKHDLTHMIRFKPLAQDFLSRMRQNNKCLVLVTNAHEKSLAVKLEHTLLDRYLDQIISAHEIGYPKESPIFWQQLSQRIDFDNERSLLIDDNLHALTSAHNFGIKHLLAVSQPASNEGIIDTGNFQAMDDFQQLLDSIDNQAN